MSLAVDIGRHRTYGARFSSTGPRPSTVEAELLELGEKHPSLLLRCNQPGVARRFTEALVATAGFDNVTARAITAGVMSQLVEAIERTTSVEERTLHVVVAVPVALGPQGQQILLEGFADAGLTVNAGDLVARPIAALAGWLADRQNVGGMPATEPIAVFDNDSGEISVLVANAEERRLLAIAPVSLGPLDNVDDVIQRTKTVLARGASMLPGTGTVRADDWAAVSASFGHVILSGSGAEHPAFEDLVSGILPAAPIANLSSVDPEHAVIGGLTELEHLRDWSCCWPTGQLLCDGESIRLAGPLAETHEELELESTSRSHISVGDAAGLRSNIQVSSVLAAGVWIPQALGSRPKMRLLDDGRVLVLGAPGVRPLSFVIHWPVPGLPSARSLTPVVPVSPLGRRALGLVSPRVSRERQTKAE